MQHLRKHSQLAPGCGSRRICAPSLKPGRQGTSVRSLLMMAALKLADLAHGGLVALPSHQPACDTLLESLA